MPIVSKGEPYSMKLNGCDDFKWNADDEKHTNGTDDAQNFPSGVLISNDVPECLLCRITFDSLGDFESHSLSLEHAQKVLAHNSLISLSSDAHSTLTSPLKNESERKCVDKIIKLEHEEKIPSSSETNNVLLENEAFKPPGLQYSCSLCIKKFNGPESYKQHIDSKSHKRKVAFERNSFAEIKRINGHTFCDICEKEFTGEKPYKEHIVSKKHRKRERYYESCKVNTEDFAPKAKKIKIESISEKDKQYFCEMSCSGSIPYLAHLAGNAHKKYLTRSEAGIKIEPSTHQLASLNDVNYVSNATKNCLDLASSVKFEQRLQFLKENSDDNLVPKAKKAKIELSTEKEKQWFCEICKKQCSGPVPYSAHITGKTHMKNVATSQTGAIIQLSTNQIDPFPNDSNVNLVNIAAKNVSDLAYSENLSNTSPTLKTSKAEKESKMETDKSKPWFCRVCNVQCSGAVSFSQHIGGKSHIKKDIYKKDNNETKTNINNSTEENRICSQNQNSNVNLVNIAAKNVSDLTHSENLSNTSPTIKTSKGEKESKMEIDKSKPWFCRICNVQCSGAIDFSQHISGKSHIKKDICKKDDNRTKTNVNDSTKENSFCPQNQNMCEELKVNYEEELKKSVKIFPTDEDINFD